MKKLTVLETSIIGIFVGFVVAAYMTFLASTGGFIGDILGWISLQPIANLITLPQNEQLAALFIFYVIVYTIYGALIGLLLKKTNKSVMIAAALILIVIAAGTEQVVASKQAPTLTENTFQQTAAVILAASKPTPQPQSQLQPQQYFGMEADGDLNGDSQSDVAFIIPREDKILGQEYYLAAAVATSTGHIGSNLLYLGTKVKPLDINIANEIIVIDYTQGISTSTKQMYAELVSGNLQWITVSKN